MTTGAFPSLCRVERRLPAGEPVDVAAELARQWSQRELDRRIHRQRIAIGLGSRGIAGLAAIARQLAALVRAGGGEPFIVPAMGSHGGATPEGQLAVLNALGVTEESAGCPLRATMETVVVGHTPGGLPVHLDRFAAEADGVIIANRVKPHTDFRGPHESGLLKILAIGLGKEAGASLLHSHETRGLRDLVPEVAAVTLAHTNLVAGVATVEDGYHRPVRLAVLPPGEIAAAERDLLAEARALLPRLPVDAIDVLVVDMIGKDISGTGLDTNVIGRLGIAGEPWTETPRIRALVALDLSAASHGNALGVGLADFITRRLLDKIDFALTAKNVATSGFLERGRVPLVLATDAEAIDAALTHVFRAEPAACAGARMVRIRDTLTLDRLWITPNLLDEVRAAPGFLSAGEPHTPVFKAGALAMPPPE
jgi:hypothetical protein